MTYSIITIYVSTYPKEIIEKIKKGEIVFSPHLDTFQLQAHSVDLRLGFTFLVPKSSRMTPKGREALLIDPLAEKYDARYFDVIELEKGQYFELLPQEHVLVSSFESIKVPDDLMAVLYPRSSTNRKGMSVDLTGIIDAGYEGQLTIPVRNNTRSQVIRLYPGERFCQVVFESLTERVTPRKSRYHQRDIIEGTASEEMQEVDLIKTGEIKKLKETFPVIKGYAHDESE
ncbi:dCTP deaminase [Candidatus Campbellbacteria bacterium]|nr:MAG: dCTP deaminase [Candidatus Campbellbacteria bacterium]